MDYPNLLRLVPFVVLLAVHHFLLAPLLYRKRWLYFILTAAMLAAFGITCFAGKPGRGVPPEFREDAPLPRWVPDWEEGSRPVPDGKHGPVRPEVMEFMLGIFLIAGDLGLVSWARMRRNERQMQELKAENLNQQLKSLRYQINPHFFMNTLNNIQSLIYTDPEKATEAVSEFSKLMRIVLYEGDAPTIPLSRELEYLRHYISLMKLRYPETVRIETALPADTGNALVPPLLMASFVENAFKHGISYEKESFVRIVVETTRSRVIFRCTNSRHDLLQTERHGLGMENVRRRLALLYGNDYALRIDEQPETYDLLLDIPVKPSIAS